MAMALKHKRIKCPNCGYEGKSKITGAGGGLLLFFVALLFIGFFFPPALILAVIVFLWMAFKPAAQICPKCKFPNPIPQ